jgi:general secretion pathway protein A
MYEAYWRLRQKPFENAADPQFYYPAEPHQAALLKLRYAVENRRGAALLAGPSGSGKTLIATMLRAVLDESCAPLTHLVFPQMPTAEFLGYLADELDGAALASEPLGVQASVRRIGNFLRANTAKGRHAVVAIDEAHLLDVRTLEALRLLLNFEIDGRPGMTLLLIGQPALLPTINRMPSWEERLGVKCLLRPFHAPETADYAQHRLRVAGATRSLIEPAAFSTLHELTGGVARKINRIGDLALLVGYAEEQSTLNAEHLEAVCRELVAVTPET